VLNVTGGTASDMIAGGWAGGLLVGGKGGDAIALYAGGGVDTVAYLVAGDSKQDFVNAAGAAAGTQDAISGFATGIDKIDVKAFALDVAIRAFVAKTYATTALLSAAEAVADFYLDGGIKQGAVAARVGSDTYLVVDANGDHLFSAARDLVVKLTGVTTLAQGMWSTPSPRSRHPLPTPAFVMQGFLRLQRYQLIHLNKLSAAAGYLPVAQRAEFLYSLVMTDEPGFPLLRRNSSPQSSINL